MEQRCETCDTLWRTYAKATTDHVNLIKEQEAVAASGQVVRFRELDSQIEVAAGIRLRAQHAVKRHLAKDHDERGQVMAISYAR